MITTTTGSLRESIARAVGVLPRENMKALVLLLFGQILSAVLDTIVLSCVALFISVIAAPEIARSSSLYAYVMSLNWPGLHLLETQVGLILLPGLASLALLGMKNALRAVLDWRITLGANNVANTFGSNILDGILHLPYQWHLARDPNDLVLILSWRTYLGTGFIVPGLMLMADVPFILFMLGTIFYVEPLICIPVAGMLGAFSWLLYSQVGKRLDKTNTNLRSSRKRLNRYSNHPIRGIKDVKISGNEQEFAARFDQELQPYALLAARQKILSSTPGYLLEFIGLAMLLGSVIAMLLISASTNIQTTSTIALFAVATWRLVPAFSRSLKALSQIRTSLPYLDQLFNFQDAISRHLKGLEAKGQGSAAPINFSTAIEIENMSFTYDKSRGPALENISFSIAKGETVGIIGSSGAGKSTLVDIIIGLLPPTEGAIKIDGRPLDESLRASWVEAVGYVPQAPFFYEGTIEENIAFGVQSNDIQTATIRESCRLASMHFIEDLPQGTKTIIGERGTRLSGGQSQRVAIARALYRRPEIVLFDEATSSLDPVTEQSIMETVYRLKGKLTMLIIAHRLSTVDRCDRLIWIDKGRIMATGPTDIVLPKYREFMISHPAEDNR